MKKIGLVTFFLLLFVTALAQKHSLTIKGNVFHDKNGNGKFDSHEKGLKGIPVSNGDSIVFTDKKGQFVLQADSASSIFPILPSGLHINGSKIVNANFFSLGRKNNIPQLAFGLRPVKQNSQFKIGAIGDIQVSDSQEIGYANNSVMAELAGSTDIDFNIFLGDLVNDNIDDLSILRQMLEALPASSWAVTGNHDRNEVPGQQHRTFKQLFGATDYAFNYADVHFIILNNVYANGNRKYEGRFTEKQLRFVKNDLALVPKNKLVVICQHIPMMWVKNKSDMLSLMNNREKVLILAGHTHRVSRQYLTPNIMEIVTGASCGNWWTGERDWQGTPSALMQGGSPRNYFIINFDKNNYQFHFKGVGLDPHKQMTIWVSGQDTLDIHVPALHKLDKHAVIANIFAGSDTTTVRMQIDNGEWIEMEKADLVAPNVERIVTLNKLKAYPTPYSSKAALRHSRSSHIWKGKLPESLSKGIHSIKIEASEPSGFQTTGNRIFLFH